MPETLSSARSFTPRWVHRLACGTAGLTFLLIVAGGVVKSKGAGLAVPDWPLSYGMPDAAIALGLFLLTLGLGVSWVIWKKRLLAWAAILSGLSLAGTYFLFGPVPHWYQVDNLRAEHGHRLIAGTTGFLMAILAGALWQCEERRWVRRLALVALLAVICQALLGGLTVRYLLPGWISASHGSLAQAFFAMVVALAVVTSPRWGVALAPSGPALRSRLAPTAAWLLGSIYLQVIIGTGLRHTKYFLGETPPTVFIVHLSMHLLGLLLILHLATKTLLGAFRQQGGQSVLLRPAKLLALLLGLQLLLGVGALVVRLLAKEEYDPSPLDPLKEWVRTAHVALAALLMATGTTLLCWSRRVEGARPDSASQTGAAQGAPELSEVAAPAGGPPCQP